MTSVHIHSGCCCFGRRLHLYDRIIDRNKEGTEEKEIVCVIMQG
jgi:hypothetical protein